MQNDRDRLIKLAEEKIDTMRFQNSDHWFDFSEKMTEIIDYLLANGVILTPCKVGDTIYQIDGVRIYPSTIHEITYTSSKVIFVTENIVFDEQAINNSIFLTPEEAEKALERSKGNA